MQLYLENKNKRLYTNKSVVKSNKLKTNQIPFFFYPLIYFLLADKKRSMKSPDIINKLTTKNCQLLKQFKEEEWQKRYRDFTAHLHLLIVL